jgi:hypothetical protein
MGTTKRLHCVSRCAGVSADELWFPAASWKAWEKEGPYTHDT